MTLLPRAAFDSLDGRSKKLWVVGDNHGPRIPFLGQTPRSRREGRIQIACGEILANNLASGVSIGFISTIVMSGSFQVFWRAASSGTRKNRKKEWKPTLPAQPVGNPLRS